MSKLIPIIACLLVTCTTHAQMWNGQDTLYGNEWINYDQSYFRIPVTTDGIYHIPATTLSAAGIPSSINARDFQLFHLGQEVPLHSSTDGPLQSNDVLIFYGEQNRDQLDRFLFDNPDEDLLNPYYSMFSDTAAYYLTWNSDATPLRYIQSDNNLANLPAKEQWFWYEEQQVFSNSGAHRTNFDGVSESIFDIGEGFATAYSNDRTLTIDPSKVANVSEMSQFNIRMTSSHGISHQLQLSVNGSLEIEEEWSGTQLKDYTIDWPTNQLNGEQSIQVQGLAPNNDRYAIAHLTLKHPRTFDFGGAASFSFQLTPSNSDRYLEIENFNTSGTVALYDITNSNRYTGILENGIVKFKLPPSFETQQLIVVNEPQGVQFVSTITPIDFIDYSTLSSSYLLISNPNLYSDAQGNNWVQAYAEYRSSSAGGDFSTLVIDINQLYEQFAYGIRRHPLSIRNFAHYLVKTWEASPQYMLLLGKGREYFTTRTNSQLTNPDNASFHIPTYGRPGSDNLLLGTNSSSVPLFPIGRIAAETPEDISFYLDKVQDYESTYNAGEVEDRIWRKQMLHLGGGGSPFEQNSIRSSLGQMENIVETNSVGADVFSFYKTNSDPIQQSQSNLITSRINDGVGIITFFGHSGTGGFDFSIDDPSTYENVDRYPVMLSLGCLSGQIHTSIRSVGENFIFQKDKGAIAFFASVGLGYISPLNLMASTYYGHLGSDQYGQSIGKVMQTTLQSLEGIPGIASRSLHQQFSLHGDPALRIHPLDGPDYTISEESIRVEPEILNAQLDSFNFIFDLQNIGQSIEDSIFIEISRAFPNGARVTLLKEKVPSPAFSKTYQYRLPVQGEQAIGFNRYFIRIDPDDQITEQPLPWAEQNNRLVDNNLVEGFEVYIFANGTTAIYPPNYAILPNNNFSLQASTADVFANKQDYLFQLDTTRLFNSPIKQEQRLNQEGGILSWDLSNTPLLDNTVYYWRVTQDSTTDFGFVWSEQSFTILEGSGDGWNQSHFYQFTDNQFTNTKMDSSSRQFQYLDDIKTFRVRNGIYPDNWPELAVNNDSYLYIPWDNAPRGGLAICVIDPISGDPWTNTPPGDFGSNLRSNWAQNWPVFPYDTRTIEDREKVINFLQDTVPSGHYVLFYSIQNGNNSYEPWEWAEDSITLGTNLLQVIEAQGAQAMRILAENNTALPYIFFYKKDDPTVPSQEYLAGTIDPINHAFFITGSWDNGNVRTSRIGPANSWSSFEWQTSQAEALDEFGFDVYGVRADSTISPIFTNIQDNVTDLSSIDASTFPYLQIFYHSTDTLQRTPPQLDYWRVLFEGVPEAAINPTDGYSFYQDTIQQGDILQLNLPIRNISSYNMDSVLVKYTLRDELNNTTAVYQRFAPLPKSSILNTSFSLPTTNLDGINNLSVEVNPDKDQAELYHFNNVAFQQFLVTKDQRNPVLDVTFDGTRIINGDIVSPNPNIVIRLQDENEFLALGDSTVLRIFLKSPNANDVVAVNYDNENLIFYPEMGDQLQNKNQALIEFSPELTESGRYTLIVQGQDASGNSSGNFDYKIEFEVVLEKRISNVFNYPNPFSTSTQFVYTLTGNEIPEDFTIQIMTVSGRLVRELTQAELGPLKIGTHRTEYAWDGTDTYGDRLANGVYLYRVLIRDSNGNAYEKYDNGTDRFFKNNIGKLVILR